MIAYLEAHRLAIYIFVACVGAVVVAGIGLQVMRRYPVWRWVYQQQGFWFQRVKPVWEFATRIYAGRRRSGKTLFATRDAILLMRRDVRVLSNYRITDPETGRTSRRITSWFDVLYYSVVALTDGRPTVFVIDEIHMWANSRFWDKMPGWWFAMMSQMGHYGCGIIATTQNLKRCEISLRELVDSIHFVRRVRVFDWLLTKMFRREINVPLFRYGAFDPLDVPEDGTPPRTDSYKFSWIKSPAYMGYSTQEIVAVHEFDDSDETQARILELSRIAQELARPDEIPTMSGEVITWMEAVESAGLVSSPDYVEEVQDAA